MPIYNPTQMYDESSPQKASASSSSLHQHVQFCGWVFVFAAARTLCIHPLNIALIRRRCSQAPTTVLYELKTLFQVARTQPRVLLHGLPLMCGAVALSEAIYLTQLLATRDWLFHRHFGFSDLGSDVSAALFGEMTRQLINVPLAALATRQMTSPSSTARSVWRSAAADPRGVCRNLSVGMGLSLCMGPLWTAAWWGMYEYGKRHQWNLWRNDKAEQSGTQLDPSVAFTSALIASAVTAMIFNPFLVIRTRVMQRSVRPKDVVAQMVKQTAAKGEKSTILLRTRTLFAGLPWSVVQNVGEGLAAAATYESAYALAF